MKFPLVLRSKLIDAEREILRLQIENSQLRVNRSKRNKKTGRFIKGG